PDAEAGRRQRHAWGMAETEPLVGLVGRLAPVKDVPLFLRAAALLARDVPRARFVCVGQGPPEYQAELAALASKLDLDGRVRWAGPSSEMRAVYSALTLGTNTSASEGFSNVIAEPLACGVPCVVTDVGDSARIVGRPDLIVPPAEPGALARTWRRILDLPAESRRTLGESARQRIIDEFGVAR